MGGGKSGGGNEEGGGMDGGRGCCRMTGGRTTDAWRW